jgi:TPR repeat protein
VGGRDVGQAVALYRSAADQGHPEAQARLAHLYARRAPVPKDLTAALVPQDPEEAARWYRRAAANGSVSAQAELGRLHAAGDGVVRDLAEAIRWYRQAAEQGSAKARRALAKMYEEGRGVTQSNAEALQWYLAAVEGSRTVLLDLGRIYRDGRGVPRDLVQAYKWFSLAYLWNQAKGRRSRDRIAEEMTMAEIAKALELAQTWVLPRRRYRFSPSDGIYPNFCLTGLPVPEAKKQEVEGYRRLAEQSDRIARFNLARAYEQGWVVPQDYAEAMDFYEKACEQADYQADYQACYLLGRMYLEGRGVARDYVQACRWFVISSTRGAHKVARSVFKQAAKLMTPEDIKTAQSLARAWRPKSQ